MGFDRDLEREKKEAFNQRTLAPLIRELNSIDAPNVWYRDPLTQAEKDNGPQWQNPRLANSTGEKLTLRVDGYGNENRLEVSGQYGSLPDGSNWFVSAYMRGEHKDPQASMSLEKTPKQLAADIYRRVLKGGYRFYRAEYLKRVEEQTERNHSAATMAQRMVTGSAGAFTIRPDYHGRNDAAKGEITLDSHVEAIYTVTADSSGYTVDRMYIREADVDLFVEFVKQLRRRG